MKKTDADFGRAALRTFERLDPKTQMLLVVCITIIACVVIYAIWYKH